MSVYAWNEWNGNCVKILIWNRDLNVWMTHSVLCIICDSIKLQFYDALTRHTVKYIFYFAAAPCIPLLRVNRKNKHKYWFVLVEPTVCWVAVPKQSIKSKSIPMLHAKMCIGSTRLNCHIRHHSVISFYVCLSIIRQRVIG